MKPNKKYPYVIGVTGGIGSGKTALLRYAARHYNARVIRSDDVGRELMAPEKSIYRAIVSVYGPEILKADGEIDREKLSAICFSSPREQERLNRIEHPLIREEILRRISRTRRPAVLLEAALLFEGEQASLCDEILFVYAKKEERILRLERHRGYTENKSRRIIKLQLPDSEFRKRSTAVLDNSGDFSETLKQFDQLLTDWGIERKK